MPIDFIVIGIVLLLAGLSAWYIISQKKKGRKCIGCPDSQTCSHCNGGCSSCNGCGSDPQV